METKLETFNPVHKHVFIRNKATAICSQLLFKEYSDVNLFHVIHPYVGLVIKPTAINVFI